MKKEKSKSSRLKTIKKKCWLLFSDYIRKRDKYICYTCRKKLTKSNSHAGHFKHNRLDLDEMNVHCQCVGCNTYKHGNLGEYAIRLIKDYGQDEVDLLILRANQHTGYSLEELEEIYNKLMGKRKEQDE